MNNKKITLYSLSTCSHCRKCRDYIATKNLSFDYIEVDLLEKTERKPHLMEIRRLNPKCSFPTMVIGDNVVVGFKEQQIAEALDKLNEC